MSDLEKILDMMGDVTSFYGLYEPKLWKDKLGESCWKCEIRTTHGALVEGRGSTPLEAVKECHYAAERMLIRTDKA